MDTDFEKKVREAYDYIHGYGYENSGLNVTSLDEFESISPEDFKEFIKQTHIGYRKGQEIIIEELIAIEQLKKDKSSELKELRRNKEKDAIKTVSMEIKKLNFEEAVYRNLADSMAWNIMQSQYWIARRFYSGDTNRPSLLNSNIESLHIAAKEIYKEHPNGFVLYSDITSFIDISDLLLITEDCQMRPIEVKEGTKAKEVFSFIEDLGESNKEKLDEVIDKQKNPKKFIKQVDRTLKQMEKASRLTDILQNEKGEDPFSGTPTNIGEVKKPMRYFHETLMHMFAELRDKTWSFNGVENIVVIGMYRDDSIALCDEIFKKAVELTCGKVYPIFPYQQQLFLPVNEPFFQNPIGIDKVMDIIMGRIRVLFCIDFEALIAYFKINGFDAGWLSKKETQKLNESRDKRERPFAFENRSIFIEKDGKKVILGDTFISKLVFDNLEPASLMDFYSAALSVPAPKK